MASIQTPSLSSRNTGSENRIPNKSAQTNAYKEAMDGDSQEANALSQSGQLRQGKSKQANKDETLAFAERTRRKHSVFKYPAQDEENSQKEDLTTNQADKRQNVGKVDQATSLSGADANKKEAALRKEEDHKLRTATFTTNQLATLALKNGFTALAETFESPYWKRADYVQKI